MARRERREKNNNNIGMFLGGGIILIAIVAFIVDYILYSNTLQRNSKSIVDNTLVSSKDDNNSINMIEQNTAEASSSIGKTVEELENEEVNKVSINTSNIENTNTTIENNNIENNEETKEEEIKEEIITEENVDFTFPVGGEILKEYAKDNLIYSETLDEWTTHLGIDFKAEKTEVVKASADGIIKSIKNDPRYGLTIVIEHAGGFESVYASLLSSEFVTVGEEVKQGDSIGTIGNTATFEIADETHLHFEIKKDGKNVDPSIYLK